MKKGLPFINARKSSTRSTPRWAFFESYVRVRTKQSVVPLICRVVCVSVHSVMFWPKSLHHLPYTAWRMLPYIRPYNWLATSLFTIWGYVADSLLHLIRLLHTPPSLFVLFPGKTIFCNVFWSFLSHFRAFLALLRPQKRGMLLGFWILAKKRKLHLLFIVSGSQIVILASYYLWFFKFRHFPWKLRLYFWKVTLTPYLFCRRF